MTDYKAINANELVDQLHEITTTLEDADLTAQERETIEDAMSEINGIIHGFDSPISIRDRQDGFEVVVTND